jgi:sulfur carrier protein ThiS adenylyltransferase
VGSIGRQVARTLAAIGARRLQLIDFDHVENSNRTTQGYSLDDIGVPKVIATARDIQQFDPTIELELVEDRFRPKLVVGEAVFCCVDSIEARAAIWRSIGKRVWFWADGRMLADTIRVLVACDEVGRKHYPTTLFPESEALPGSCTATNTFDSAEIAAGLMVHQFRRWLRGMPPESDLSFNVLASELVVHCGAA